VFYFFYAIFLDLPSIFELLSFSPFEEILPPDAFFPIYSNTDLYCGCLLVIGTLKLESVRLFLSTFSRVDYFLKHGAVEFP
jgi:hypothetical protein